MIPTVNLSLTQTEILRSVKQTNFDLCSFLKNNINFDITLKNVNIKKSKRCLTLKKVNIKENE